MINLMVGKKGSGKTKKLVDFANNLISQSTGNVVVIEKGLKLTYDLDYKARLIDIDNYSISDFCGLYGFLCGICAGNYDVTDILVDSTLKIAGEDLNKFIPFIDKLNSVFEKSKTNLILSISVDENELPNELKNLVNIL